MAGCRKRTKSLQIRYSAERAPCGRASRRSRYLTGPPVPHGVAGTSRGRRYLTGPPVPHEPPVPEGRPLPPPAAPPRGRRRAPQHRGRWRRGGPLSPQRFPARAGSASPVSLVRPGSRAESKFLGPPGRPSAPSPGSPARGCRRRARGPAGRGRGRLRRAALRLRLRSRGWQRSPL